MPSPGPGEGTSGPLRCIRGRETAMGPADGRPGDSPGWNRGYRLKLPQWGRPMNGRIADYLHYEMAA
jgi:hypothetical protein